jgi:hypothetical protein
MTTTLTDEALARLREVCPGEHPRAGFFIGLSDELRIADFRALLAAYEALVTEHEKCEDRISDAYRDSENSGWEDARR